MQRSYFVGEELTEEDIKARFENGVLRLSIPKKEPKKAIPEKKLIAIE
jgi:HSP20 family molecular chaperone IbpA